MKTTFESKINELTNNLRNRENELNDWKSKYSKLEA